MGFSIPMCSTARQSLACHLDHASGRTAHIDMTLPTLGTYLLSIPMPSEYAPRVSLLPLSPPAPHLQNTNVEIHKIICRHKTKKYRCVYSCMKTHIAVVKIGASKQQQQKKQHDSRHLPHVTPASNKSSQASNKCKHALLYSTSRDTTSYRTSVKRS